MSRGQTVLARNISWSNAVSRSIGLGIVLRHLGSIGVRMPTRSSIVAAASRHRSSR